MLSNYRAHAVAGLCAGIIAHFVFLLVSLI